MTKSFQYVLLALAIALSSISTLATTAGDLSHVNWDQAAPITWSLFQGTPPADAPNHREPANIIMTLSWHASFSVSSNAGTWIAQVTSITVTNTMSTTLSWVINERATESILNHEQLHFDLSEVYRRKLECELLRIDSYSSATQQGAVDMLNASLHQIANAILQEAEEMQALYDSQTSGSLNSAEQARWQNLISNWLLAPTTAP
jgi:hypothetical protein